MNWDRIYQIGVVVADLDDAIAHYAKAGIGPFHEGPSAAATDRRVHGLPSDAVVRGACVQLGPIELELLQPVNGDSFQDEMLKEKGEHALHVCAYTDDLDADTAEMAEAGFPVVSEGNLADGGRFAYYDTRAVGGLILERHEMPR
ncbi:VOC family protein [Microbacterium sp.]|uniref:VOC family protein n=1 Tax=Microbacterium sp. TaxID=51671 RepID=UPI003F9A4F09